MSYSDIVGLNFNFYSDIRFWISFLVIAVLFRALGFNRRMRNVLLGLFNIIFLFALPRFTPLTFLFLLCISLLIYIAGYLLNRGVLVDTHTKKLWFVSFCVGFVILVLAFFKYSFLQETFFGDILRRSFEASDFIFVIGIS